MDSFRGKTQFHVSVETVLVYRGSVGLLNLKSIVFGLILNFLSGHPLRGGSGLSISKTKFRPMGWG